MIRTIFFGDPESCLAPVLVVFLSLAQAANLDKKMIAPWEKDEYRSAAAWKEKAEAQLLDVTPCVAGWMDVCSFGKALEESFWNLVNLQKNGVLNLLSKVYQRAAHPLLIGVDPMPYDRFGH